MLSQHPSVMDQQQRHHRRQLSTPIKLEGSITVQTPSQTYAPTNQIVASPLLVQPIGYVAVGSAQVGIHTNTGQHQQQFLQVAQQHDQARPGQQQPHPYQHQISADEFRAIQHRKLDAEIDTLIHGNANTFVPPAADSVHYVKIERSRSNPEGYHGVHGADYSSDRGDQCLYLAPPQNLTLLRPSASNEAGTDGWSVPLQQNWITQPQRPLTPPSQRGQDHVPQTPTYTPHLHDQKVFPRDQNATIHIPRTVLSQQAMLIHDNANLTTDHGETDRTSTGRSAKRTFSSTGLLQQDQEEFVSQALPSPPQTVALRTSRKFDIATIPGSNDEVRKLSFASSDNTVIPHYDLSSVSSPQLAPSPESPLIGRGHSAEGVSLPFRSHGDDELAASPMSDDLPIIQYGPWDLGVRPVLSPGTIVITELGLDTAIEPTGISAEEVQAYISEPDPTSGKWTCLYPDCGKLFGRKENIRSHIQTHLGDRQYRCAHCNKKFVRHHDLKRHAKIHSGVKPFPCRCGNSFARHDALTRHRQRGICSGRLEGVIKKEAKRGRPRKVRPTGEDGASGGSRREKHTEENAYANSDSGTSESSHPGSPSSPMFDVMETTPGDNRTTASPEAPDSFPPSAFTHTPPVSPYSTGLPSPVKASSTEPSVAPVNLLLGNNIYKSEHGQGLLLTEGLVSTPPTTDHAGSPPDLSHSSPQSTTQFAPLDFLNSSEIGPSSTEPDFDLLAAKYTEQDDSDDEHFDAGWNDGEYGAFVKEDLMLGDFGRVFGRPLDDDNQSLF